MIMGAAEKLKALNSLIVAPDFDDMDSIHTLTARQHVQHVLPQIVAVVREAQRQVAESHQDDVDLELAAALTDLDEALF